MLNLDHKWIRGRTFFKGRWCEITFMRRTNYPIWDKHSQILGKYADSKRKLEEKRQAVESWIRIVSYTLSFITIILAAIGLSSIGFPHLNSALSAFAITLALTGEVFRRTHFVHYGNALISATPFVSAKGEVIHGGKSEEKE